MEQPPDPRRLPFGPGTMLKLQVRGLVQRAKSVMGFEDSDEDSGDEFDNDEAGEWKPMGNYGKARNLKSINLGDGRKTKSGRRKTRALASHESVGAFSLSELMMTDADDSESGSRKGSMMSRGSCSSAGRRPTIDPGFTPSAVAVSISADHIQAGFHVVDAQFEPMDGFLTAGEI